MTKRPLSVSVTLFLVLLNVLVWLVFGLIIALEIHPGLPDIPMLKGIMVVLSFLAAGVLLWMYLLLRRRAGRIVHILAVGLFAASVLVTFFDDFGLSDLVVVIINLIPLVLLIKDRAWYLRRDDQAQTA